MFDENDGPTEKGPQKFIMVEVLREELTCRVVSSDKVMDRVKRSP